MKKSVLLFLFLATGFYLSASEDWNYKNYFRSDSAQIFSWDAILKDWVLSSTQIFYYNSEGKVISLVERSRLTGLLMSKIDYSYNENGFASAQNYYSWNISWIPTSRYSITYDEFDRTSEILVQVFKADVWVNNRLSKNYEYDEEGRLHQAQGFAWNIKQNEWFQPRTEYSTYDEEGRLIKRVSYYFNGTPEYQVLYGYDIHGLRSESHAQYPSGSGWFNWWMINYTYNNCGGQILQIRYQGVITDWIPQTKTVSYTSFNAEAFPGKKIPVCHNGHTIYISKNALKAHLAHGDCIGECTVEDTTSGKNEWDEKEALKKPPFTVYPNPANEKITIKFDKDECDGSKRVELTDFYGKPVKSFNIKDNSDITIYKQNLPSGKYYLRLVGKEVYSAVVIFE